MTIEEIKDKLSTLLGQPYTVQVYFVLKQDENLILRLADIEDEKTEPEVDKLFLEYMTDTVLNNNDLQVCELSTADERTNAIFHYDYTEYPEELEVFQSFDIKQATKEVEKFKGSKYVKSNPCGIYKKIKEYLIAGRRVLFVGLPCQVEAVKCYIGEKFDNGLYTVDLICHGSPSPKVLDMFLAQYDIDTKKLSDIQFRNKNNFSVREGTSYIVQKGVMDKYSISFLNSISYTENCYHCQYANIMRVSDITLGDSWGSNLDIQEQRKGVSLILNQTLKGKELLEQSELELMDVELNRAIEHNHQLKHPSIKPNTREIFFDEIKNGKNFNAIVRKLYPKQSAKQIVKMLLIKAKIMGGV